MGVVGVAQAARLVGAASRITVLTGAGISTDSGIPDFRGPAGVWTLNPAAERLSTYDDYLADPDVRRKAWITRRDHPVWTARPNAGHQALVDLERAGRLHAIITQNIDGLHQAAGSDGELVIEVHGNMFGVVCLRCGDKTAMTNALQRVAAGEADPACLACGGILKSDTISFGQALDELTIARAFAVALECDLFLAVGTSLQVYPVAGLVEVAHTAGARVVIVNAERTPYDTIADAVVREPIGTVLPRLIAG